jgi:hypothetical protein
MSVTNTFHPARIRAVLSSRITEFEAKLIRQDEKPSAALALLQHSQSESRL